MNRHFIRLFQRLTLRGLIRHPLLALLNITGIGLGVAVFLAIQMANRSAVSTFLAGVELVAGRADLEVRGAVPVAAIPAIRVLPGVAVATPAMEYVVTLPDMPGDYLRILGVDPFTSADLRPFRILAADGGVLDIEAWLREPDGFAATPALLRRLGDDIPEQGLRVETESGTRFLRPLFVIETTEGGAEQDRLAVMDIGWVQELSGRFDAVDAVQILVEDGADIQALAERLRAFLPEDIEVGPTANRSEQLEAMIGSFQLNLTALSLVSMLVGMFLIYSTVSASVVRRRTEIGMLRCIGVSPAGIRWWFLGEAAVPGVIGSILGVLLAVPLASILVGFVSRTITSLYVLMHIDTIYLSPGQVILAMVLGIAASQVAAWRPATAAVRVDPCHALHPGAFSDRAARVPWAPLAGAALALVLAAVSGWLALHWRIGWLGFASAFLVLAGFSLASPRFCLAMVAVLDWFPALHPVGLRLALRNFRQSLRRNAVTVASLAAAIAMTVSIAVMIHSFRGSVTVWLERTLQADLFVAPAANTSVGLEHFLPPGIKEWLEARPEVGEVATFREFPIEFHGARTTLGVLDGRSRGELDWVRRGAAWGAELTAPDHVALSESFANRFGVDPGGDLVLTTPEGPRAFRVIGVCRDYTRDAGVVFMDRATFLRHWNDDRIHSAAVFLREGTDAREVGQALRAEVADRMALAIPSNRDLRERIGEIFDQTFAITAVLRLIAVVVAVAGVMLALVILVEERVRQTGLYRSLGASRTQVGAVYLWEAGLIGGGASVLGTAAGCALALVLTWVINKAYFGWTVDLAYPAGLLLLTPLWIVPAALAAALPPALRATRIPPAEALRAE